MQVRTFTVPFAKVVGDEAHELEFGPDDFVVVRPLFGLSRGEIAAWQERIQAVEVMAETKAPEAEAASDQLVLDLLHAAIVKWSLEGPDGSIEMPGTPEALNALPGALGGSLYQFLTTYRGEAGANPTKRS